MVVVQFVQLSSAVFEGQDIPNLTLQVYVMVQDVEGIYITADFMSQWTAYANSAMDLWRVGDIILPPGPITTSETDVYGHSFAGEDP